MKLLIKTKLLEGKYCELREYELFKVPVKVIHCLSKDYKSCNHIDEEYMTLTLNEQKKGKITNTQQSKFPPYSYYRMYKFLWCPKGKIKPLIEQAINPSIAIAQNIDKNKEEWEKLREKLHK